MDLPTVAAIVDPSTMTKGPPGIIMLGIAVAVKPKTSPLLTEPLVAAITAFTCHVKHFPSLFLYRTFHVEAGI